MKKIINKMKLNKAKKLARKYQPFTITEGGYTTAIGFIGTEILIEF